MAKVAPRIGAAARDLLGDDGVVGVVAAPAAVLLGDARAQLAELGGLAPEITVDAVLIAPSLAVGDALLLDERTRGLTEQRELVVHPGRARRRRGQHARAVIVGVGMS
jgi:hypothetical protein